MATQKGNVTVSAGAALVVTSSTVNGTLTATRAASITYCGSTQSGGVSISGTTGGVTLGGTEPDGTACTADTIPSSILISGTDGPVTVSGLKEQGILILSGNTGGVTLNGISLSGLAFVLDNRGHAVTVSGNTINGSLTCTGNNPAPGDNGAVNIVSGLALGQCAAISSRKPPPHTAPVLANIESTPLAYAAGAPAEPVTATLTVSSADATTLTGATVSITSGLVASGDVLGFTNQNGITGSYNASTGVLSLSGTASLANYQAALRSVDYSDSNGRTPTSGTRTISFQVDDGHLDRQPEQRRLANRLRQPQRRPTAGRLTPPRRTRTPRSTSTCSPTTPTRTATRSPSPPSTPPAPRARSRSTATTRSTTTRTGSSPA